mmetsp:Transcript_3172/g.6927  ORF Transcript_3172/g.6927 Transcript_3172/m.6927 type:complete len:309 (+) Transcript_3172:76-1002(+)
MMPDEGKDDDRLRTIHTELSSKPAAQRKSERSPWLPLESNPDIFTSFARRIACLPPEWKFADVLMLDDETLASIPRPVAAVILLFPTTDRIYEARAREKQKLLHDMKIGCVSPAAKKAFHLEQVSSFGNACGTIAAVHALTNAGLIDSQADMDNTVSGVRIDDGPNISGPIAAFHNSTKDLATPRERGTALVSSGVLHNISDEAASDSSAQTECPSRGDTRLGHHYCAFVSIEIDEEGAASTGSNGSRKSVHLVELDGTKVSPVDHGPIVNGMDLLQATGSVVKERWMALEPNRIDFSLMALARSGSE